MHNAILTVAGRDTGATLFGPADMQLSANTQVKTIEGHYTGHFKAVVTKPQNVMVMRDVACAGYVAGCNTRWFARDDENEENGDKKFSAESARQNIQSRLSFDDDMTDRYASMLAFPAHEGQFEGGQLDTVMSITTRLLPWEVNGSGQHNSFPGGDAMYNAYSGILGLSSVHYGEDMKAAENQDFISQGSTNNATCFIGPHRKYDPFTKSFMSLVPGQGHFGPDAIPGVKPGAFNPNHPAHARRATRQHESPPPLAGRALAPRRVRVAQDGARLDGRPRARTARADGLLQGLRTPLLRCRRLRGSTLGSVCVCVCLRQGTCRFYNAFWRRLKVRTPHLWTMVRVPYFVSAQLDGVQRGTVEGSSEFEGWVGLIFFNLATWVSTIVIDIMLLSDDFHESDKPHHVLQTGALTSVIVSFSTIAAFWIGGMCFGEPFTSGPANKRAATLPPFATALISGGLKATLGFTYVLLILSATSAEKRVVELLVAQVALKHFGSAMVLTNQRLHHFADDAVSSATY